MALIYQNFDDLISHDRGTGATRINATGLIVGVDFSSTSNMIDMGSKSFTLTADANVNRDWPVGSSVRAVDQVGGGAMIGTVTSYTPSTQVLVINVASITGSGTSTNWRIGSLEFRRDFDPITLQPRGGLVEGGATNLIRQSNDFLTDLVNWELNASTTSPNAAVSPNGSSDAVKLIPNAATGGTRRAFWRGAAATVGQTYAFSVFIKAAEYRYALVIFDPVGNPNSAASIDLLTGTVTIGVSAPTVTVSNAGDGWWRLSVARVATNNPIQGAEVQVYATPVDVLVNGFDYTTDGTSGVFYWGAQFEQANRPSSYTPTTTAQVTRAADLLAVDGARFSQFYNQAQGTLFVSIVPSATAMIAVAASLNDGTVNNAIRIQRNASGLAETPITSGGVLQANPMLGTLMANAINKVTIRLAPNNVGVSVNGAAVVTDTSVILPIVDRLSIGMNGVSGQQLNGWIRRIEYSPIPMSDSELVSAST